MALLLVIALASKIVAPCTSPASFSSQPPPGVPKSFWRLPCRGQSGIGRLDPLMYPGEVSAHVHTVAGGNGFGFRADYDTLLASSCTSCAVLQDKSAYWTPTLNFVRSNGSTVMVDQVGGMLVYYKSFANTTSFPEGFRMVTGNPSIRNFSGPFPDVPTSDASVWLDNPTEVARPEHQLFLMQRALGFNCLDYSILPAEASLYRHQLPPRDHIDSCTDGLRLELAFPSCGNGSADALDHKSHMSYPSLVQQGVCPTGYPVLYPLLFFETIYDTYAFRGQPGRFVLSYGDPVGTGYHGDFLMGWESAELLQKAIDECRAISGHVGDCPHFELQSDEQQQHCRFAAPDILKNDNPTGPRDGLAIDIPIQYGPQEAAAYPVRLSSNTKHRQLSRHR